MIRKIMATGVMIASVTGFACTIDGKQGLLPENDMWISTTAKMSNNMTEERFNAVIDKVVKVYEPIISSMGANLKVSRKWEDGTVNAYASRSGSTWNVAMFGGLARHKAITEDGFALVVCHEIGHHIGGAPKKSTWFGTTWATNEGQADYFATLKCLRKAFRNENNAAIVKAMDVPAEVVNKCAEQFSEEADQLLCQRGSMAGLSTAKLFQDLRSSSKEPSFSTPDTKVVSRTDHNHPAYQCRLDTYFAGATCEINDSIDVDNEDEAVGVCYRDSGDTEGVRPLCWFKPEN
ncbi:MAG: hypothetical protein QF441_13710 [Bacteriovoracaceae bacterium]|jgi:hypothetical protein|nr:hypothetical protein [Bacteriovoracaceae bacterium]|tara:strand:- start:574 stop:1446 length:873 start_codon:yes stop_codon:yes gene_type:complete